VTFFEGACFGAVFLGGVFFRTGFLAVGFFAVAFFGAVFLAMAFGWFDFSIFLRLTRFTGICRGSSWEKEEEFSRPKNHEVLQIVRIVSSLKLYWMIWVKCDLLLFTMAVTDRMNMYSVV